MTYEQVFDLLLAMLAGRHTHDDPEEQKDCDSALVAATIEVMMLESELALVKLRAERQTDTMLRSVAHNPNAPKA